MMPEDWVLFDYLLFAFEYFVYLTRRESPINPLRHSIEYSGAIILYYYNDCIIVCVALWYIFNSIEL